MGDINFRILGPVRVEHHGAHLRLGGPRQQTLLALLMLEANRTVRMSSIIDAVWGEGPPASATAQVRICVSSLRRAFAAIGLADVIETRPSGYHLHVAAQTMDLHCFQDLVARSRVMGKEGRLDESVALLREALELWHGPVAAGLESSRVRNAAAFAEEERLSAVEECLEHELSLGRHHTIIGELRDHAAEHPFRERFGAQLMLALYRSGRQADALEVFRAIRARFAGELGLEPGEGLRSLEAAILAGDSEPLHTPSVAQPVPVPTPGAAPGTDATADRLGELERENSRLRAERDVFKQLAASWLQVLTNSD
ncbi:winged helix-turn-helix domain-containing protein [Streptomyces sp. NBC_01142]|uniref:AfsR/SARP family transcriptional regulator n=1 Tax=Streptomyces sp. NBC_01142 TaxID=2975865 RepID=UPI002257857C|nr:BTAD domain-containing putative transcriptional regulator [Streptomyces sp. NBC_01142]MCX4824961.1 winged helix-turn-helix domain-containing protein [Streptomyces sp. NBC_01142]